MTLKVSLAEIGGSRVLSNPFKEFVVKETLVEYDAPLLLLAQSKAGEDWLFKWCDSNDDPSINRWIAFKASKSRIDSIKEGTISLREVVTLPEDEMYIFDAKELFSPLKIRRAAPEKLPSDYLPSDNVSIYGMILRPSISVKGKITLGLHVFSEVISDGQAPVEIISPLQDRVQQFISWAAHAISSTRIITAGASYTDWAALRLAAVGTGSFKMEYVSNNSDDEQLDKLSRACEALAKLTNGDSDIESIKQQIGDEGIFLASLLAEFISKSDLSISISWFSGNAPHGYLALDKRRANNLLSALDYDNKKKNTNIIVLKLTPEEVAPLKKEVNGSGGHQNLLRNLKSKLKEDNTIELTADEIEKIIRYGLNYGGGGFQGRLVGIAKALKRVDASLQASFYVKAESRAASD